MIECRVCGAKSQLFLCKSHAAELSEMLDSLVMGGTVTETVMAGRTESGGGWRVERDRRLPGLVHYLRQAAVGHARMGDRGVGRSRNGRAWSEREGSAEVLLKCRCNHPEHIDGPCTAVDSVAAGEEPDPLTGKPRPMFTEQPCSCTEYEPAITQQKLFSQSLAAGRVNSRAADVLVKLRTRLDDWVEHVRAATGIRFTTLDESDLTAAALWVAHHSTALANLEEAGRIHGQVRRLIDQIESAINRPAPNRPCGPCPTIVGAHGKQCGYALSAGRDDVEITCPSCEETYNVEELLNRLVNQTYYLTFTVEELLYLLPLGEEAVPRRTLYDWIAKGKLKSRGEDPHTGKPKYLMADVRRLRTERPKRKVAART